MSRIFKKLFTSKKEFLLIFFFFLVFALFLPVFSAQAQPWYVKMFTGLPTAIAVLILRLVLILTGVLFSLASWLLTWAIGNPFGLSFTDPGGNPVIRIGWTLLRDLTNMLFILGLAYIGLATSLNFGGFKTKKIFLNLIIIALMINFTPVICGIIVDISNILANFFMGNVSFDNLPDIFEVQKGGVWNMLDNITDVTTLGKVAILNIYGFLGALILFLFALLFFIRPLAIWILVIFSPIAFFAWIFEETRGWFKKWWNQFLQWSFVAIPAGFFIYLSQQILVNINEYKASEGGGILADFVAELAPYFLIILFLLFGFFMALTMTAMGAGAAIGLGKKAGGLVAAGAWAATKKGAQGARNILRRREGREPGEESWLGKKYPRAAGAIGGVGKYVFGELSPEERERWGKGKKAGKMAAQAAVGAVTLGAPFWARPLGRYLSSQMEEDTERRIQEEYKKTKGKTKTTQEASLKNALSRPDPWAREKRIGSLQAIVEDNNFEDIIPNEGERKSIIKRVVEDALKIRPEAVGKNLRFLDPEMTVEVVNEMKLSDSVKKEAQVHLSSEDKAKYEGLKDKDGKVMDALANKLIATIKPSKMNLWTKNMAAGAAQSEAAHKFWTGAHIAEGAKEFGATFLGSVQGGMKSVTGTENPDKQREWYEEKNKPLKRYFDSSAAQGLGIGFGVAPKKPGESIEDVYETEPGVYETKREKKPKPPGEAKGAAPKKKPPRGRGGVGV